MENLKHRERFGKLNGKRVFITGGSGLIGLNLARQLVHYGAHVTIFDREKFDSSLAGISFIKGDVTDYSSLYRAMKNYEIVIHAAALLGVEKIVDIPLDVMKVNVEGTVNALECACRHNAGHFLFISSSEVYGDSKKFPLREEDSVSPISIYGISKLAAEAYCLAYYKQRKIQTTSLRLFNVYGPGQKENFVITNFISAIINNKPPIIYGHGNQSRSYTYITDAVKGILLAITSREVFGEVFNLGNTEEVSVLELANYLISLLGSNLKPCYQPFGKGVRVEDREIHRRQPDILKAQTKLGFDIEIPWKQGIAKYCEWFLKKNKK